MLYKIFFGVVFLSCLSCNPQTNIADPYVDWKKISIKTLTPEQQKVRDYIPLHIVIAHRGSVFWVPEETEAAFRWARNIGADYLEADLQLTKDGVVLALHDIDLRRTTNIEQVYPNRQTDPVSSFTYEELMGLDAGSWFNAVKPMQAKKGFSDTLTRQYISTLQDLIKIAEGKRLKRNSNGTRIYKRDSNITTKKITYAFEYEDDPADNGHRPGIYLETKEPWVNPGIEEALDKELRTYGWHIGDKPSTDTRQFIDNSKGKNRVNIANTYGKVLLQTFSQESLKNLKRIFKGIIPVCYLLWEGKGATDMPIANPQTYGEFINFGVENGAHIIGPSIEGPPNNYKDLLAPWQSGMIRKSKMFIHPYSFDTQEQMGKYYGIYNYGIPIENISIPYMDGMFTNRAEITIDFYFNIHKRPIGLEKTANQILKDLGY